MSLHEIEVILAKGMAHSRAMIFKGAVNLASSGTSEASRTGLLRKYWAATDTLEREPRLWIVALQRSSPQKS